MKTFYALNFFLLFFLNIANPSVCFQQPPIERSQIHMGTQARILIYGGDNEDVDSAFSVIKLLDSILSDYNPESEISEINRMAGASSVKASKELIEVLSRAMDIARETEGAFDPTIGALTIGAYGFGRNNGKMPKEAVVKRQKSLVNYKNVVIEGGKVHLKNRGMMLDLGGIGKGYAIDKAVDTLRTRGIQKGIVSLSGDVRVFGDNIEIGIKHPKKDGLIAVFRTGKGDLAISTSGGYERSIQSGGKKYHHLLVPSTGRPMSEFLSVTVVLKGDNTACDAYATALFTMGKDKALSFLKKHPAIGAFFVYPDGTVYYNETFRSLVSDFDLKTV